MTKPWDQQFMRAGRIVDGACRPFMTISFDRGAGLAPEPVLLAANHRSVVDVFVSLICCYRLGRPTRFIVGRAFFSKPGLGRVLRAIGCIEGGRGSGADTVAIAEIRAGTTCAIMPEGAVKTMEPGRILAPLLPGVAEIWARTSCQFHAVGISGAGNVWPSGRRLPVRPHVRVARRPVVHVRLSEQNRAESEPCSIERVTRIMEATCKQAEIDRLAIRP